MEMKVTKLIDQKEKCDTMLKSLRLFDETGASEASLTKEQSRELMDILIGYGHILSVIIDNARVNL